MSTESELEKGTFSNSLSHAYRTIGEALLLLERERMSGAEKTFLEFRERVCVVSTEALESYLEDLLSIEVTDERLSIPIAKQRMSNAVLHCAGAVLGVAGGLVAISQGLDESWSFVVMVALASPFVILVYTAPRVAVGRRLLFARVLSREIFRRKGIGKNGEGMIGQILRLKRLIPGREAPSTSRALSARTLVERWEGAEEARSQLSHSFTQHC